VIKKFSIIFVLLAICGSVFAQHGEFERMMKRIRSDTKPAADAVYDLGSPTKQWGNIYFGGTLYDNGVPFTGGPDNIIDTADGLQATGDMSLTGFLSVDGDLTVGGLIYGDGSQLINITTTEADTLATVTERGRTTSQDLTLQGSVTIDGNVTISNYLYLDPDVVYRSDSGNAQFSEDNGGTWADIGSGTSSGGGGGDTLWEVDGDLQPNATGVGNNISMGNVLYIEDNGDVGIGTTTPSTALEVTGIGTASDQWAVGNTSIRSDGVYVGSVEGLGNDGAGFFEIGNANAANLGLRFYGNQAERMRLTKEGNVGIGTTSPTSTLQINGDLSVSNDVTLNDKIYLGDDGFDLREYAINGALSPMLLTGGILSEGTNAETLKVTALTALVRTTDSTTGELVHISVAETDNIAIGAYDTKYHVGVEYNNGSPQTTVQAGNFSRTHEIGIGTCMKEADSLEVHFNNAGERSQDGVNKLQQRAASLRGMEMGSNACVVANDGLSLNLTIDNGVVYQGLHRITPFSGGDFDSSDTDTFRYFYRSAVLSEWLSTSGNTVIDNTYYDDGSGALKAVTTNEYGVHWIYIHPGDDHVLVVYGQDSYKLAQAQEATSPSSLPTVVGDFALLIARVTVERNGSSFALVDGVTKEFFNGAGVTDHGALGGLSDDDHSIYYLDADVSTSVELEAELLHDNFSDYVAKEHYDWTASVGTIHSDNYTDTNTQLADTDINDFGFIKNASESDGIFVASDANSITSQHITDLDNLSGTNSGDNTVATSGDAAVDFFGAGVSAVTDATTCTDLEGTGLLITGGTLNAVGGGLTNMIDTADGNNALYDLTVSGDLSVNGDIRTHNLYSTTLYGDGSNITGLPSGGSEIYMELDVELAQFISVDGVTANCWYDTSGKSNTLVFDPNVIQSCRWTKNLDDDYGAGTLYADVFFHMDIAEANEVQFTMEIMAYTPGTDSADFDTDSFDTANEGAATTVAATAGRLYKQIITLSNDDSLAAGDILRLQLSRDATDGTNDDAVGFALVTNVVIRE